MNMRMPRTTADGLRQRFDTSNIVNMTTSGFSEQQKGGRLQTAEVGISRRHRKIPTVASVSVPKAANLALSSGSMKPPRNLAPSAK